MNRDREAHIREMVAEFDDLPDGAFLGVLEECGIDTDDLAEVYARPQPKSPRRKSNRKRKSR